MLRVPTYLGPSSIHGIGVFAVERILAGAEVWRFSPGLDLDLDRSSTSTAQAWVMSVISTEGRYSVGQAATRLTDPCQ